MHDQAKTADMHGSEAKDGRNRIGRRHPSWRAGALAAGLVALGLSAAACSSGPGGPGVASVSSSASQASSHSGTKPSTLAYAQCMQSHGIKNFPEPGSNGALQLAPGQSLPDPNSPQFQAAFKVCVPLNPAGSIAPNAQQQAQQVAKDIALAKCMRSHGVPNFPDPDVNGTFNLQGIDTNSPQVQSATAACASTGGSYDSGRAGAS
jgi:hypothetical protein